jgi:hypothetical protein
MVKMGFLYTCCDGHKVCNAVYVEIHRAVWVVTAGELPGSVEKEMIDDYASVDELARDLSTPDGSPVSFETEERERLDMLDLSRRLVRTDRQEDR